MQEGPETSAFLIMVKDAQTKPIDRKAVEVAGGRRSRSVRLLHPIMSGVHEVFRRGAVDGKHALVGTPGAFALLPACRVRPHSSMLQCGRSVGESGPSGSTGQIRALRHVGRL